MCKYILFGGNSAPMLAGGVALFRLIPFVTKDHALAPLLSDMLVCLVSASFFVVFILFHAPFSDILVCLF